MRLRIGPIGAVAALVLMGAAAPTQAQSPPAQAQSAPTRQNASASPMADLTAAQYRDNFVKRAGSHLTVAGHEFRFSGANVEWLGLKNYGPQPSSILPLGSTHYPTKYEIDDVFTTAREMGATVIRAQTLGDTIGCPQCLEPQLGQFNPKAFASMDLVVAEARKYGIKLIGQFDGDANGAPPPNGIGISHQWYCSWRGVPMAECEQTFFTDPLLITDFENHMRSVLNHVNPYTGLAYKDDPTFAGWADGNVVGAVGTPVPVLRSWLGTISHYFRSVDRHQLFIDISALDAVGDYGTIDPGALLIPDVDVYSIEYYPFVCSFINDPSRCAPELVHQEGVQAAAAGKTFAVIEFGWDRTNFPSAAELDQYLTGVDADPNIVGDNYWELLSHANGHGWQPVPADASHCGPPPNCPASDDGNWWALYYTGVDSTSNTAPDMADRAQLLRAHGYRMSGYATLPAHNPVPAPTITSTTAGTVVFQGAAGSRSYTIQKQTSRSAWTTVCNNCVTDTSPGWHDPNAAQPGCYRVFGENLDGVTGPPSPPAGNRGCRQTRSADTEPFRVR